MSRRWLRHAAYALAVSPGMVRFLEEFYGLKGEVVVVGYDEDDFGAELLRQENSKLRISSVGSIYPSSQQPDVFFGALDLLIRKIPEARERLEVLLVGSRCEEQLRRMLAGRPCERACAILPKVSPAEATGLQRSSDILLLLNVRFLGRRETLSYPSKIFEYFGARRPILAIPGDGDYVDALLRRTQTGIAAHTAEEAEKILEDWYKAWRLGGRVPYAGKREETTVFTHRSQAERIAAALDRFAPSRTPASRVGFSPCR